MVLSPHDPKTLYVDAQMVFRTTNEGQSWELISPDLTRGDPKTLEKTPTYLNPSPGEFWGPITARPTVRSGTARSSPSPNRRSRRACSGPDPTTATCTSRATTADRGRRSRRPICRSSRSSASSTRRRTTPAPPTWPPPATSCDDTRPTSEDSRLRETWTKIVDGIPAGDFTRAIREDPTRKGLLYAGTETGVYVSFDDGGHWQSLRLNLPVVPVHDLVIKDGDLLAATHGRSFWMLDNVALLSQLTASALTDKVTLFNPRTTVRYGRGASLAGNFSAAANIDGANPPNGVVVPFYLKEAPTSPVTLTISKEGTGPGAGVVRTVTFNPPGAAPGGPRRPVARAGANTYVWDMRYPGATVLPDAVFQGRPDGPVAPPGDYTLELAVNGVTTRTTATIVKDPRLTYTDADLETQFAFLIEVRDKLTETMTVVSRVRDTRREAEELVKKAKETRRGRTPESQALLDKAMTDLNNRLYTIEERLVQYRARANQDLIANPTGIDSKLARLLGFASMGDGPPTDGAKDLLRRLNEGIAERRTALDAVDKQELATLKRLTTTLSK